MAFNSSTMELTSATYRLEHNAKLEDYRESEILELLNIFLNTDFDQHFEDNPTKRALYDKTIIDLFELKVQALFNVSQLVRTEDYKSMRILFGDDWAKQLNEKLSMLERECHDRMLLESTNLTPNVRTSLHTDASG